MFAENTANQQQKFACTLQPVRREEPACKAPLRSAASDPDAIFTAHRALFGLCAKNTMRMWLI
jgi:hypothetical protein